MVYFLKLPGHDERQKKYVDQAGEASSASRRSGRQYLDIKLESGTMTLAVHLLGESFLEPLRDLYRVPGEQRRHHG